MKPAWPRLGVWISATVGTALLLGAGLALLHGPYPWVLSLLSLLLASAYRYERRIYLFLAIVIMITGLATAALTGEDLFPASALLLGVIGLGCAAAEAIFRLRCSHQRLEGLIRAEEARFSQSLHHSLDGFALLDARCRVVEWNQVMEQLSGVSRPQATKIEFCELMNRLTGGTGLKLPQECGSLWEALQKSFQTQSPPLYQHPIECQFRRTGMPALQVQIRFFPVQNTVGCWIGMWVRDVTPLKQVENELADFRQNQGMHQRAVDGAQILFAQMEDGAALEDIQETIVQTAVRGLRFQAGALLWIDPAASTVSLRCEHGNLEYGAGSGLEFMLALRGNSFPLERMEFLSRDGFQVGKCFFIPQGMCCWQAVCAGASTRFPEPARATSTPGGDWRPGDILLVPIQSASGEVYGYLLLVHPDDGLRPTPKSLDGVELFAAEAGLVMGSALLKQTLAVQDEDRLKIAEALRTGQTDLTDLQSAAQAGSWSLEDESRRLIYSDELIRILGCSSAPGSLTAGDGCSEGAIPLVEYIHPDDIPAFKTYYGQMRAGVEPTPLETRIVRADGSVRFVKHVGKIESRPDGTLIRLVGFVQDITALHRTQLALRQSEDMLRGLITNLADGLALIDYQGNIQEWNKTCEEITGIRREAVIGKPSWVVMNDLVPENRKTPEDFDRLKAWTIELLKPDQKANPSGESHGMEFRVERLDGSQRVIQYRLFRISTSRGGIGCGLLRDVTELRAAEIELRESEQTWRTLLSQTTNAVVLVNPKGKVVEWNQAMEQLTGLARNEVLDALYWDIQYRIIAEEFKTPAFYNYLKVETAKALQSGESALLSNPIGSILKPIHRNRSSIEQVSFTIRASQGFMLGSLFWDVTPLVVGENELNESREKFRRLFDESPVGIELFDAQGKLLEVNRAFMTLFGVANVDAARGLSLYELLNIAPDSRSILFLGESVHSEKEIDFSQLREKNRIPTQKTGKMALNLTITPYSAGSGSRGYLVQWVDLSDQKQAQNSIREQQKLRQALRDTANALTSTLELNEVMERIGRIVRAVVPHDAMTIMLVENGVARGIRSWGYFENPGEDTILTEVWVIDEIPNFRWMAENGKSLIIPDTRKYEGWKEYPYSRWVRSNLGVPIIQKGHLVGFISLDSKTPDFFTEEDCIQLEAFAGHAGIAIENARLYSDLQQQAKEIAVLYRASAQLLKYGGDLENLRRQIVEVLTGEFPYAVSEILLLDPTRTYLRRLDQKGVPDKIPSMPLPIDGPGLTTRAARTKQVIYAPDVRLEKGYVCNNPNMVSELDVPFIVRGQVIGVLDLQSSSVNAFDERSRRLVAAFAEQAGLALENARLYEEVQQMAIHDELTGVYNRRGLYEFGQREVERAIRYNRQLSALFLDIDHFKKLNDQHSYFVGDQVLRAIASCLRLSLREVDLASRYGGEEFVVLLPETDLATACEVAERLRADIENTRVQTNRGNMAVTVSIGVARLKLASPHKRDNDLAAALEHRGLEILNDLLDQAGKALHTAKRLGRNRVVCDEKRTG